MNWMGNPGLAGLRASAGLMVNYLYDLPALDANAAMFKHPAAVAAAAVPAPAASADGNDSGVTNAVAQPNELQLALGQSVRDVLAQR